MVHFSLSKKMALFYPGGDHGFLSNNLKLNVPNNPII
jgi:hypothetical protein